LTHREGGLEAITPRLLTFPT